MLFNNEVKSLEELVDKLDELNITEKVKICVMCFLFDRNGKLILQRRGPGARDEIGKLQAIGGSINGSDVSLRDSLRRELSEEAGSNAIITIDSFIGAILNTAYDKNAQEMVNWVLLAYKGILEEGELINCEPDRCTCFEKRNINEFEEEDMSKTTWKFLQELKKNEK